MFLQRTINTIRDPIGWRWKWANHASHNGGLNESQCLQSKLLASTKSLYRSWTVVAPLLVTDEEYNSTEQPVHELSLFAFPAVTLRIVDQIIPNKQAKRICHFSSITLNMTI